MNKDKMNSKQKRQNLQFTNMPRSSQCQPVPRQIVARPHYESQVPSRSLPSSASSSRRTSRDMTQQKNLIQAEQSTGNGPLNHWQGCCLSTVMVLALVLVCTVLVYSFIFIHEGSTSENYQNGIMRPRTFYQRVGNQKQSKPWVG